MAYCDPKTIGQGLGLLSDICRRHLRWICGGWLFVEAVLAPRVFAADFLVRTWRTDDGLPDSTTTAVQQTREGYLWVGTSAGLARFDGVRFERFSAANLPELGSSPVVTLFEDRDGTLWVAMESGRLLALRDGVARIHMPDAKTAREGVISMAQDVAGALWIQTSDGRLGRLTNDGVAFVAVTGPVGRRTRLGLAVDADGTLWVGTKDGLRLWDGGGLVAPPGLASLAGILVDALAPASEGGLWAFADHRLWRIRDREIIFETPAPSTFTGSAVAMVEAFDRKPWVAAEGGRLYYVNAANAWRVVTAEMGLRSTNLSLHQDREGNLWRGSAGGGLTQVRPSIFGRYELPAQDPDRHALGVCADQSGTIWALLNMRTVVSIVPGEDSIRIWGDRKTTPNVRPIFSSRAGTLWFGALGRTVYRMSEGLPVPAFEADTEATGINALFEDAGGNIWIGYSGGAGVGFMPEGDPGRWRTVDGMPDPDVRAIGQGADGAMWFGTSHAGACRLSDGRWTRYATRDGLPSDAVRCFLTEDDGTVWMGTLGGLVRWKGGAFATINTEKGLWHDAIYHIVDDQRGHFWMSSPGGIFHVAREQLHECADGAKRVIQCTGYNRNDGMAAQECAGGFQPAGARTPDGRLWFPTADGLLSVDPRHSLDNTVPPPVLVEEIAVEGVPRRARAEDSAIVANPGENRIGFRFTALSLTSPEKVRFCHQLEGMERDWSTPSDQREVMYPYVPPGRYRFRVIASNNAGVWSPTAASVTLIVRPYFWQTAWFWTSLGIVGALSVAWSVRCRERRKARLALERMEREHAVERERARIAKDIHDDIGASLTQITFLSQRVDGARHDVVEVERWNKRIVDTAQSTIRSLDEIVWAVNPKYDTLESLAGYLGRFAQEHLELAGVSCRLEIPTVLPVLVFNAEVRHNLLLATREALQNIVVHARATVACVALELRDDILQIRISDDGRGLGGGASAQSGDGIANMRCRMEEIGGCCELMGAVGGGTEVRFTVPRACLAVAGSIAQSLRDTPVPAKVQE